MLAVVGSASTTISEAPSSFTIVPTPIVAPSVAFIAPLNASRTVSSGSTAVSPVTDIVTVPDVVPAAKVSVPAETGA